MNNLKNKFTNYWEFLSIKTACKLNLFDLILQGENTLEKLSVKIIADKKILNTLLIALKQSNLIFDKNKQLFLTELGQTLTENHKNSVKYSCILWAEEHLTAWQNFDYTLLTGKPAFDNIYGKTFFDFISDKPDKLKIYHRAMAEYARDDYENICSFIDFSTHKSIIDIGGGIGTLIKIVQSNNSKVRCYLFDKQEVIALSNFKNKISGDFFIEIPNFADAIILSRVIHDWNDEKIKIILFNVYNALPQNGILYVIENFADEIADKAVLLSLNMAIMTNSYERTGKEYISLLSENRFKILSIKKINEFQNVLICRKILKNDRL